MNAFVNLGNVLLEEKRAKEAETLFRQALPPLERKLGKDHFYTASAHASLGAALTEQNRFAETETELTAAQRSFSQTQGVAASRRQKCLESLVALYQAWDKAQPGAGRAATGAEWSQKLASLKDSPKDLPH